MPSEATLEKPLPNNLDAERSVLGAVILDNNALNAAIENLKPEDFFLDQHRRVFTQMIALGESQQAIDLITLTEELHRRGDLEAAGGAPYLASLADGMPRVSNVEHYARIVKEKAILRNLIHATHNIQQRAFEGEDGADAILDNAESSIFQLAEDRIRVGLLPIRDIVRDNFERLEKIFREGKSITGIPTGYVSREDWRRMTEALGTISSSPIWVDDAGSISVLEIGAKARRLKRDKGLSLLIVDYLQLITARGRFGNRQEEVASISRALKGLAKELQIPVLVLSQLTRAPERDEREETELRIAKQRNGPTDTVRFVFRSRLTRFEEAAPDAFSQFTSDDL